MHSLLYIYLFHTIVCSVQTSLAAIVVGSQVWVEDPDIAWNEGHVLEVKGEEIKVKCTSGKTVITCFVDSLYLFF